MESGRGGKANEHFSGGSPKKARWGNSSSHIIFALFLHSIFFFFFFYFYLFTFRPCCFLVADPVSIHFSF